jgi:hypothetical protein
MRTSWVLAMALASAMPAWADCAPDGMARIAVRTTYPDADWSKPPTRPDIIHRAGARYLRLEEPDGHAIQVIALPDMWWALTREGPAFHFPVDGIKADVFETSGELAAGLEYGCEAEFVRARMPEVAERTVLKGRRVNVHRRRLGEITLEIALAADGRPVRIRELVRGRPSAVVDYDAYQTGLPVDPGIFTPPKGLAFREGRPEPPKLQPAPPR